MLGSGHVDADAALRGLDLLPGPPGQLTTARGGPADGLRDRVERHGEDVVEDEDDAFGRAEPVQHDQQGQPDVVIQRDPVGGVRERIADRECLAACHELDLVGVVRALAAGPGRPDLIQAQPTGHHDQPAASIVDLTGGGAQQAGERVLHHILGRADVAQHPEGQVDQVGTVGLPGLDDFLM